MSCLLPPGGDDAWLQKKLPFFCLTCGRFINMAAWCSACGLVNSTDAFINAHTHYLTLTRTSQRADSFMRAYARYIQRVLEFSTRHF